MAIAERTRRVRRSMPRKIEIVYMPLGVKQERDEAMGETRNRQGHVKSSRERAVCQRTTLLTTVTMSSLISASEFRPNLFQEMSPNGETTFTSLKSTLL